MILDYAIHPITREKYSFPRKNAQLSVPNNRVNPVFIVSGGGPASPVGNRPFDKDINVVSYRCDLFPDEDWKTLGALDEQRDQFNIAIDHGLPQLLGFQHDDGSHWLLNCQLTANPHNQTTTSNKQHTLQASWVALADDLQAPAGPGQAVYGNFKYGHHAKFGHGSFKQNLTLADTIITFDNTNLGATRETTDLILTLRGRFGATDPTTYPIVIMTRPANMGIKIADALGPQEQYLINLASRRILKQTLDVSGNVLTSTPAFGVVTKFAAVQRSYLSILADVVNTLEIYHSGTPNGTIAGLLTIKWKPHRDF